MKNRSNLPTNYYLLTTFKNWLLPLMIAIAIFAIVRPVLAQTIQTPENITVGEAAGTDNFKQVYYELNGERVFITDTRYTNGSVNGAGDYITWIGQIDGLWQVFLYYIPSKTTTQLTFTGNNVNPKVDEKGRVVWESWDGDTWQVFFFDGGATRQLTIGDTSLNPNISGEYISYGRRDITGTWRAVVYSIAENKSLDVTTGEKAKSPKIINGEIYLGEGGAEEKFALNVSDLFLLNLAPLSLEENASQSGAILEELSATPSGVPELPMATESANQ